MPSLFRFYVCSIFFLCPIFSFFSLFSFSLSSIFVVTELMICFLVLPSHLVLVVSFSFSFSLLLFGLCGTHLYVSSFCWCLLMSCRFLFSSSSSFSFFSFLHNVVFWFLLFSIASFTCFSADYPSVCTLGWLSISQLSLSRLSLTRPSLGRSCSIIVRPPQRRVSTHISAG